MKKSKTVAGRTKRPQQMTKEELIATLLKKRQCNAKALSIVERMLESEVNPQWLLDSLQFISQSHYQDAVEERAILKICGYPLCQNPLGNIPKQQFRISTQNNKVYDISERKNFCSNGCYRSSSFVKNQIMTSPLWLRDIEKIPEYKLLDGGSSRGGVGDEIDVGPTRVTAQEASVSHSSLDEMGGVVQEGNDVKSQSDILEEGLRNVSIENESPKNCTVLSQEHDSPIKEKTKTPGTIVNFEEVIACTASESSDTALKEKKKPEIIDSQERSNKLPESSLPLESCSAISVRKEPRRLDILETVAKAVEIDDTGKCMTVPEETANSSNLKSQAVLAHNIEGDSYTRSTEGNMKKGDNNLRVAVESREESNLSKEIDDNKRKVRKQKRTSRHTKSSSIAMPSVSQLVEERLVEWFTVDSLCFLYGEQKTREMLGQLGEELEQNFKPLDSATWDPEKHDRFVNICKRLNLLDIEDKSFDEKVLNEDVVKKPLPDFNKLKEEAEKMDLRVRAFYKGQFELEPKKVTFAEETKEEIENEELPVIPLVHQHEQRALRRRLVLDSLSRVLPDLLQTIGVQSSQVNSAIRGLVGTFALTANNITFNPQQWTLTAIAIIKLLSVREARLYRALTSEASQKYLTLIQMSYNLGPAFLDLLVDRLVSSAIVPPKPLDTS